MTRIKKYFFILLLLELVLAYSPAYADTTDYTTSGVSGQIEKLLCAPTPVTSSQTNNVGSGTGNSINYNNAAAGNANQYDLYNCINRLYKFAIILAVVIGVFFLVIAGYIYMSAEGNAESVDKAKSILVSTITALVILLAGFLLLKTINPDLVQFQTIQPPSVALPIAEAPKGVGTVAPGTAVGTTYTVPNGAVADLEGSKCTFSSDVQKNEAPQMVASLESIVKSICYNISQNPAFQGHPVNISSIIGFGKHATNSYHYKGCAVDFANGDGNLVNSAYGQAIIQQAKSAGISPSRINPGVDATRTDMIHIDLGTSCPNASNVDPNVIE